MLNLTKSQCSIRYKCLSFHSQRWIPFLCKQHEQLSLHSCDILKFQPFNLQATNCITAFLSKTLTSVQSNKNELVLMNAKKPLQNDIVTQLSHSCRNLLQLSLKKIIIQFTKQTYCTNKFAQAIIKVKSNKAQIGLFLCTHKPQALTSTHLPLFVQGLQLGNIAKAQLFFSQS